MQQKINQILIPNPHHHHHNLAAAAHAAAAAAAAAHVAHVANPNIRSPPNPLGQPLIISPRIAAAAAAAAAAAGANQAQQASNNSHQAAHHHHHHANHQTLFNGATAAQLIAAASSSDPTSGLIYAHIPTLYQDQAAFNAAVAAGSPTLLEYPSGLDFSQAG